MPLDPEVPAGYILGAAIANLIRRVDALEKAFDASPLITAYKAVVAEKAFTPTVVGGRKIVSLQVQDQMVMLFERKVSMAEIARILEFSPQTVSNHLVRLGLHVIPKLVRKLP